MNTDIKSIKKFVLAGNASFTVKNDTTGKHLTYKVVKHSTEDNLKDGVWFVTTLNGSDNESDFVYIGIITSDGFRITKKSRFSEDAVSVKGFKWLWNNVTTNRELPDNVKFYHAGRCARCGRKLTTPESVETGFGPICMEKL